jgi:hypothetical protein
VPDPALGNYRAWNEAACCWKNGEKILVYRDMQSIILLHVKHASGMGVFFGRRFKYPK